ncbi:MAG TPA: hypothetical protein VL048_08840 [Xanthobacteraceae bacterium]|nr:hypothetical protein [Xanthobacteraceae bacterium]
MRRVAPRDFSGISAATVTTTVAVPPMTCRLGTCYTAAMRVEDIEEAVLKLAPDELAEFRRWFAKFESGMAPPKMPEPAAVKLGRIAGRTLAEFRKLSREP